jgi:nicotinate-nucleotide pyrophosphorylase (carboxylating)
MTSTFDFSAASLAWLAREDVARALAEDVGSGDLTAGLVDPTRRARARVLAREAAVICGAPWAEAAIRQLAPDARITWHVGEGQRSQVDQVVLEVEAPAQALLTAERTALQFSAAAQRRGHQDRCLCGSCARHPGADCGHPQDPARACAWPRSTRCKTGGGTNHRIGLYDAVLIKENHIAAAGGVTPVLQAAAKVAAHATLCRD